MLKRDNIRRTRSGARSQSSAPAFLLKTYEILENPAYNDIISWNREGNAFIVKRVNEFSEKILPKYFKHSNFASFVRQLNMYDFHKSRHENNENEFRHKWFKRGQKHLLADIKRKISEGHGVSQVAAASNSFDVDRLKKEANHFGNELESVKRHQNDLEKVSKVIYSQNSQLLKENKLLWTELNKDKEKYEKKIEKLMISVFTMAQSSGNQLGPSEGRKSLTNGEYSAPTGELTGDNDQASNVLGENENGTTSVLPDKKNKEQLFQEMTQYLQNEGGDTNLNSLMGQVQAGNMNDQFKGQPETTQNEVSMEDNQNLDPNVNPMKDTTQPEKKRGKRRGRGRKGGPVTQGQTREEEGFKEAPTKFIKTDNAPLYSVQQSFLPAQESINMMNQEMANESMRQNFPAYNLGMGQGPSFNNQGLSFNNDMGTLQNAYMMQQKPMANNGFMFASPKPYMNPPKEDELPEMYNLDYNNKMNEVPQGAQGVMDQQGNEPFSPTAFMNNPNGYNFVQPYDGNMYRS